MSVLCAGLLMFGGCDNASQADSPLPSTGTAHIVFDKPAAPEAAMPELTGFAKYRLNFVHEDGTEVEQIVQEGQNTNVDVQLKAGNWRLDGLGYVHAELPADESPSDSLAEGESDGPLNSFADLVQTAEGSVWVTIMPGKVSTAHLMLNEKLNETEGHGTLLWDISFPASVVSAELTLSRLDGAGEFVPPYDAIDLVVGAVAGRYEGHEPLQAGFYRADITFIGEHVTKKRTFVAYIFPRFETSLPTIDWREADIPSLQSESEGGIVIATLGAHETAGMEISFEPTPSQGGAITLAVDEAGDYPTQLEIEVAWFESIICLLDGEEIDGTAGHFIMAEDLSPGTYILTIIGINGAYARSTEIPFIVEKFDVVANSAVALATALGALEENTPETAYAVKLSGIKLNSNSSTSSNTLRNMYDALTRYVKLDLRDCIPSNNSGIYCNVAATNTLGKLYVVSVRLGATITIISTNAFLGCTNLEAITLGSVPPTLGNNALPSGAPFAAIYVPASALETYQTTTVSGWSDALKALVQTIP